MSRDRTQITKTPAPLKADPPKLFLLKRWAQLVHEEYDAPVYLFGSAARGELNPRDYDVAIVLTDKQFALRYATPAMLRTKTIRQIVAEWDAQEWGEAVVTPLWDRWTKDVRKTMKDAYHKHTGLVIDLHVKPLSVWRRYINIQYWRLA